MQEQLERIRTMEEALNSARAAVDELNSALNAYESVLPRLRALEDYYEGPLWRTDYDADCAGRLPRALPRGVLTEDALYDLLCDHDQLVRDLLRLCRTLQKGAGPL